MDDLSGFSQINTTNYEDAFAKAHPGKNINELMQQTNNSGILVRTEIREMIDSASGEKMNN